MGIPSYFSYIIRKHPYIITSVSTANNLYLDSNSIIYDMVHSIKYGPNFEEILIQAVCDKIDYYLALIRPSRVIIAFDGVPPMAKVKQQRERRYKSWIVPGPPSNWNTIQITPGTVFMDKLDASLHSHFKHYSQNYDYFKLSTSKEPGEGEHKIFSFIRNHPEYHASQKTLIYGLDSDLIVLSLNHLKYGDIKLLREAPAFMMQDKELHVLDVSKLADGICEIIGDRIPDYIFMTLFLGNDFMPHFPALNLRTTGFDTLIQTYNSCMLPNETMYTGSKIQWDIVERFIQALSEKEHSIMIKEYHARNRLKVDVSTEDKKINNAPILKREREHFICPVQPGWEKRYYTLDNAPVEKICKNYMDMLEWNINYYTKGCINWSMYYEYSYPPLLVDLAKHVPKQTITSYDDTQLTTTELLKYVLPPPYYNYIPNEVSQESEKPSLLWAYCRYIWESHVK
jgi:5'-3' exonuclease